MSSRAENLTKNHSPDRILVLKSLSKELDDKLDKRIFTGGNNLHAMMDPEYGHWYLKLDHGSVWASLQQRWTSFPKLYEAVKVYFGKRNIEIAEIIE